MERFNPLNDYLFLKIMGEKGDEEQCLAFLNAVLEDSRQKPIKLVKILDNRFINPEIRGNKGSILDFLAEDENGDRYEIEVQLRDLRNIEKRSLYYWAKEYAETISAGMDYEKLPRVITINIVDFDNIKLDRFHTTFHIREDIEKDYVLTDVLEIHFLNMIRFRKAENKDIKNNNLCRWLTYFDVNTPLEKLEEVIKMDGAISKANEVLRFVTQDKDFLRDYHRRLMEECDRTTELNTAREKGFEKGSQERGNDIARKALSKNLPIDLIQDLTGLSAEDILALQGGNKDGRSDKQNK